MWPVVWGPLFWDVIHLLAYVHPVNPSQHERKNIEEFFVSLGRVLPCPGCAGHYAIWQKQFPVAEFSGSRDTLLQWTVDLHNDVNRRNQKIERNVAEVKGYLKKKFFNRNEWFELKRAQEIRKEDHVDMNIYRRLLRKITLTDAQVEALPEELKTFWLERISSPSIANQGNTFENLDVLLQQWKKTAPKEKEVYNRTNQISQLHTEQNADTSSTSNFDKFSVATISILTFLVFFLLIIIIIKRQQAFKKKNKIQQ